MVNEKVNILISIGNYQEMFYVA